MSHTGKVHDGQTMSGRGTRKIMVFTEGESGNAKSFKYCISLKDRNIDFRGGTRIKSGTPVSFLVKHDKNGEPFANNVRELNKLHFLYDIISSGRLQCQIKQMVVAKIDYISKHNKRFRMAHINGKNMIVIEKDIKVTGYEAVSTDKIAPTDPGHSSDEIHLIVPC